MSTTLTNGLKLPDKGSVDWYADMQSNYAILDGAVGTIAEHTTALAGKAPAVHTHTKSDITDFPAFGNTAGTICEGNDSRLSDARTPVAHTHVKADITDLFNSVNTWGASQTFTENSTFSNYITSKESAAISAGSYGKGIAFRDYQNNRLGYIQPHLTSDNEKRLVIGADSGKIALNSTIIPNINNLYDLGSSSYQWNNVYSKGYYYNGTPWGLDKYNQWTEVNDFNDLIGLNGAELWFKNIQIEDITANPTSAVGKSIVQIWNKGTTQYCGGILDSLDTSGTHVFEIVNFGYPLNSINAYQHRFRFASKRDGTASFYPTYPNVDLGTSTNKWKTLNGINPGALSFPDFGNADPIDFSQWDVTGAVGSNYYTPTVNGWLNISIWDRATNSIFVYRSGKERVGVFGNGSMASDGRIALLMPVQANATYVIIIKASANSDIYSANFFPCLGNV